MNTLLKLMPKTNIIVFVIRIVSFFQANKRHFQQVVDLIMEAEDKLSDKPGEERGAWVKEQARQLLDISAPYLIDIIVGLAVGWLGKNGYIHLKSME